MSKPPSARDRARRGRHRVTVREVAEHAGVATMTVSRALKDPATVSTRLRRRIEDAVRELGYVPNRFAGGLASERTRIIPVVVPSLSKTVFADIVRGADDVLSPRGYQILFSNTYYSLEEEEGLIRGLLGWVPDGMIIAGVDHTRAARELLEDAGIPVVEALELGEDPVDINIGLSHFEAGYAITRYLVERGYRRIGFLGSQMAVDFRAVRRLEGHRRALGEHGLESAYEATYPEPFSFRKGGEALSDLLASGARVDAVFCANDELAVGAVLECQRRGVAVPGTLAIAGFNGLEIGAEINPSLTTILSPRYEMGRLAAEAILERIEGDAPRGRRVDVGFEVLARESA